MGGSNGGINFNENPLVQLAKEVVDEHDYRDSLLDEALDRFEDSLEQGNNEVVAAKELIVSFTFADNQYFTNIKAIASKYMQTLGSIGQLEQVLEALSEVSQEIDEDEYEGQ